MKTAVLGLGRMGMNIARRLLRGGHEVAAFNRSPEKTEILAQEGAQPVYDLNELPRLLTPPRAVWLMLPAGGIVDEMINRLQVHLEPGDIIVEGGNTFYQDDQRRAALLLERRIHYLDVGVSGGIWGLEKGYCLMIGGAKEAFRRLLPLFETLAPNGGYLHCGPTGAGHFLKMIHNGIEYGLMQAYAEGFHLLQASPYGADLDLAAVARLWNRGSVIRSWLLELIEAVFLKEGRLERISAYVEDTGEGRWTVRQAVEMGIAAPVITLALMNRFRSRDEQSFADRLLAALRREFGGHPLKEGGTGSSAHP